MIAAALWLTATTVFADDRAEMTKVKTPKQAEAYIAKYGINRQVGTGMTLLHFAAYNTDLKMVKFLLSKGADPNMATEDGCGPLSTVTAEPGFEILKVLVEAGANASYLCNVSSATAGRTIMRDLFMHNWYAKTDITPILGYLKDKGLNMNHADAFGQNILFYGWEGATLKYTQMMLPKLVALGVNVNHRDRDGATPLIASASGEYGQQRAMEILVELGADINLQNKHGRTALHMATISTPFRPAIFKKLLEFGANTNLKDNEGETPLFTLVSKGNSEAIKLILAKGADVDVRRNDGKSVLEYAVVVKANRAKTLPYLLPASKNIDAPDSKGDTLLMKAAMLDQLDVVKWLVENGANMNVKNQYNATPLQIAKMNKYESIVRYLTSKGAE